MKGIAKRVVTWLLLYEAKLVLRKHQPRIIAIVGSVGKTSTRDALYIALNGNSFVRKSIKSFNTEIGVPLTILGIENAWYNPLLWVKNLFDGLLVIFSHTYPKLLIIEVGIDRPGDMQVFIPWLKPDVIVYTRLPDIPTHVEYFASPEAVAKEKLSLIRGLREGGVLVINGDDELLSGLRSHHPHIGMITYGISKELDVRASHYQITYRSHVPTGIRFNVHTKDNESAVGLPGVIGYQHLYPALAAIATAVHEGVSLEAARKALGRYEVTPGRMRLLEGLKNSIIIDDTYNSSPAALEAALQVLLQVKAQGRKIAVLGDMLELGQYSVDEHKRLGRIAGEVCDKLLTVGPRARHVAEGALLAGMSEKNILQYEGSTRAGKELQQIIEPGDIMLIKGSQGMRMEKVTEEVMAYPERKRELLCRQDHEWLRR